jgi:glutathione synthase/RimK-type ligase-like ATP-grasp enzyme
MEIPRHYAFVTRTLLDLFSSGMLANIADVEAEPEWGHASRVRYKNGAIRITYGNDIGLNSGAAADVARDKAYTKMFLERMNIATPRGEAFLFRWWLDQIGAVRRPMRIRTTDDAAAFARDTLGFPVYAKQVDGSKGKGVSLCESTEDIEDAIATLNKLHSRVMLVEEAIELPDYRLVLLNGDLISAYRRTPLSVIGDGHSTVSQLLADRQVAFDAVGRDTQIDVDDPRIAKSLGRRGLSTASVPEPREQLRVHDISNLSLGGTAEDITDSVAHRWQDLGREIAAGLNLAFCGIDLFCADITDPQAEYRVLEVNAAPGLDHYASVGPKQQRIVRSLYARVLDVPPPM